jgi:hypothetical protein
MWIALTFRFEKMMQRLVDETDMDTE